MRPSAKRCIPSIETLHTGDNKIAWLVIVKAFTMNDLNSRIDIEYIGKYPKSMDRIERGIPNSPG